MGFSERGDSRRFYLCACVSRLQGENINHERAAFFTERPLSLGVSLELGLDVPNTGRRVCKSRGFLALVAAYFSFGAILSPPCAVHANRGEQMAMLL